MNENLQPCMRRVIKRSLRLSLLLVVVVVSGLVTNALGPNPYRFQEGDWDQMDHEPPLEPSTQITILLDGHSHTLASDGELTPEQNIQWHLANGFNAAIISDHNTMKGSLEAREIARTKYQGEFLVLPGLEWTTDRIHLNIIGEDRAFIKYFSHISNVPQQPTDLQIRQVIEQTHALGGIVVVNHYQRGFADRPSREELVDWGVDYFEIVNDAAGYYDTVSFQLCETHGLGLMTGTDMHDPTRVRVHGWTSLETTEFTERGLMEALKQRNTKLIYSPAGVTYSAEHERNSAYLIVGPLATSGSLFEDYYKEDRINGSSMALMLVYILILATIREFIPRRSKVFPIPRKHNIGRVQPE